MGHYAFLDKDNIVTEVITGRNEDEIVDGISDWEAYYSEFRGQRCIRTSYHGNIRKNFAGIGFRYDEALDAFISPQPFASWILNQDTCQWEAPEPYPADGGVYGWNEESISWVEILPVPEAPEA
jgi:hypothetical protein